MNTGREPLVKFGQSPPYTTYILSASPGWISDRTWRGSFVINEEVPDGTHSLNVSRAVTDENPPFLIPTDTYHDFRVDKEGGLSLSNGEVIAETTETLTLSWDPSTDVEVIEFDIVRSRAQAGPYEYIDTVPASQTDYVDTGLNANTIYFYQIYEANTGSRKARYTAPFFGRTIRMANAKALLDLLRSSPQDFIEYFDFSHYWMDSLPNR